MTTFIELLNYWDQSLLLAINGIHTTFSDLFMWSFSGKLIWIPLYAAILFVLAKNYSWKVTLATLLAIGLTILMADQICSSLIRPAVERYRPSNLHCPIVDMVHIVNNYRGGAYGFPSCHATNTFALATFIGILLRNRMVNVTLFLWAAVTVWSRIALGVHYPGDLLVGGIIGALCALLCVSLLRWTVQKTGLDDRPLPRRDQLACKNVIPYTGLVLTAGILVYALAGTF